MAKTIHIHVGDRRKVEGVSTRDATDEVEYRRKVAEALALTERSEFAKINSLLSYLSATSNAVGNVSGAAREAGKKAAEHLKRVREKKELAHRSKLGSMGLRDSCASEAKDAAPPTIGAKVFLSHVPGGGTGVRGEVVRIENGWVFVRNDEGRTFKAPLDRVTQDSALGNPIYTPALNRAMKELSNAEALLRLFKDRPDSPAKAHLTAKVKFLREELAKVQARALAETQDAEPEKALPRPGDIVTLNDPFAEVRVLAVSARGAVQVALPGEKYKRWFPPSQYVVKGGAKDAGNEEYGYRVGQRVLLHDKNTTAVIKSLHGDTALVSYRDAQEGAVVVRQVKLSAMSPL